MTQRKYLTASHRHRPRRPRSATVRHLASASLIHPLLRRPLPSPHGLWITTRRRFQPADNSAPWSDPHRIHSGHLPLRNRHPLLSLKAPGLVDPNMSFLPKVCTPCDGCCAFGMLWINWPAWTGVPVQLQTIVRMPAADSRRQQSREIRRSPTRLQLPDHRLTVSAGKPQRLRCMARCRPLQLPRLRVTLWCSSRRKQRR